VTTGTQHIDVCICTYRREEFLKRLLLELQSQDTSGLFSYSIVVVDNDHMRSAERVVSNFAATTTIPIRYYVEPRQNIALARNKAVENANGDYVAFIDDDEFPTPRWLLTLFEARKKYAVDGVLGPVKPHYDEKTPRWIIRGRFYDRATYPTGLVIDWRKGRTGNVLLKKGIFASQDQLFRPEFRQGEDQDFFQRMIEKGYVFIWCNEAVAYEVVPPIRWKRTFMIRRALLRGAMEPKTARFGARDVTKSVMAVSTYAAALPIALFLGHHRFMMLLVKLCDHLGKLFAFVGFDLIRDPYITE